MTTKVLLTHHHRDAIENAADRGFWMPLPLEAEQLKDVMYLTSLSYGEITLKQLVEVASFEPWREADGLERWLPFLGQRLELPKPLPLGDRQIGLLDRSLLKLAGHHLMGHIAASYDNHPAGIAVKPVHDARPGWATRC